MYSKCIGRILTCIAIIGLLSNCTLKLNEPNPKSTLLAVNPVEAECLSNIDVIFDNYFAGKITETELISFWDCLQTSFQLFLENTTGADESKYTPEELVLFLETYFLGGKKVSKTLATEAMVLKQAILGGSLDAVTRAELRDTLELMKVFRKETIVLLPHLPFTLKNFQKRNLPPDEFDRTAAVFHASLENIGNALHRSVGPYSFDSLERLLDELDHFLYAHRRSFFDQDVLFGKSAARAFVDVIRHAKSVFISPPANVIGRNDWRAIFRLAPRYFTLYLRVSLLMDQPTELLSGEGLKQIFRLGSLTYEYVGDSVKQHPNGVVTEVELQNLAKALEKAELLPLKSKTIEDFIPIFVDKFLRDLDSPIGVPANGINEVVLARLWKIFVIWSEGQFYMEGLFRHHFGDRFKENELKRDQIRNSSVAEGLKWTVFQNDLSEKAIKEMRKNVLQIRAAFPLRENRIQVPKEGAENTYNMASLTFLNLMRTASRFIIQGYAKDLDVARDAIYLTPEEAMEVYDDVFPIANDLGLLSDPNSLSIGNRIVEADLFLYSAEGDSNLSQDEATELLAGAISAVRVGQQSHKEIAHECLDPAGSPLDPTQPARPVPAKCYFEKLGNGMKAGIYWDHVPGLVEFYKELQRKEYLDSKIAEIRKETMPQDEPFYWLVEELKEKQIAELLARPPGEEFLYAIDNVIRKLENPSEREVLPDDSTGYILITYYLEYLFDRYDTDYNGSLSKAEGERAYSRFRGFIEKQARKSGLDKEKDFVALFHYLLKYQNLPNESFWDKIRYAWYRYIRASKYETDRLEVAKLLSKLLKL